MYYVYDEKNSIKIPKPFGRVMTPIFMGDDPISADCGFSVHIVFTPEKRIKKHGNTSIFAGKRRQST